MKKRKSYHTHTHTHTRLKLLLMLLFLVTGGAVVAQTGVKNYRYDLDLKHYYTIPVDDAVRDYLMAGTNFSGGQPSIHFLNVDDQGNINSQKIFAEPGFDHRVVTLLQYDPESYYIVALRRDNPGTVNERDRIRLLRVYADGTLVDDQTIESTVASGSSDYTNMYPMHAIEQDGYLYICGYVTREWSTYPSYPDFVGAHNKKAFVLRYDPNTNAVLNANTYDVVFLPLLVPQPMNDYDIAMRLIPLSNGNIYVTGSCNVVRNSTICADGLTISVAYTSGTMNMVLDGSLNPIISNQPFCQNLGPGDLGEYGLGIIPNPDAATGGYFVMGNYFRPGYNAPGFAPNSPSLIMTYLDNTYTPPSGPGIRARLQVAQDDYSWGLHTMESASGPDNFLIAGMQTDSKCFSDDDPLKPTLNNYSPFVTEVTPFWNGADMSGTSFNYWYTYLTQFTTGPNTFANSYHRLGGGLNNNLWQPIFACRRTLGTSVNDNIGFSAPSWNADPRLLNFRFVYADQDAEVPDCPESYRNCVPESFFNIEVDPFPLYDAVACSSNVPPPTTTIVVNCTTNVAPYPTAINQHSIEEALFEVYELIDCGVNGGVVFKQSTSVKEIEEGGPVVTISPNPANKEIQIHLQGVNDGAPLKVVLIDQTGRSVSTLFNGLAKGKSNSYQLKLPAIAPGLYFLTIESNGNSLGNHKLIIQ